MSDGGHFDHLKRDPRDQYLRDSGLGANHIVTFMTHDTQTQYTMRFVSQKDVILEVQSLLSELGLCDRQSVAKDIVRLSKKPPGTWGETLYTRSRRPRPMIQSEAARVVAKALARIALADEGETAEPGVEANELSGLMTRKSLGPPKGTPLMTRKGLWKRRASF